MTYEHDINHHGITLTACCIRLAQMGVRKARAMARTYHVPVVLIVAWGSAVLVAVLGGR